METEMNRRLNVLAVGATGSIGRHVIEQAIQQGHSVRALVRSPSKAKDLPHEAEIAIGDLTRPDTLSGAVEGVEAIIFAHGSDGTGKAGAESVGYGGVRNILSALDSNRPRIALMTAIGVTNRNGSYTKSTESHDWKRRSERLVRVSGLEYTIVRPGWFDYNRADEHHLVFLQGDTRHAGNSSDGVIARSQIAEVLIHSLTSDEASHKTFELVATKGPAQKNLDILFAALDSDLDNEVDGVRDAPNQPLGDEPERILEDLRAIAPNFRHA